MKPQRGKHETLSVRVYPSVVLESLDHQHQRRSVLDPQVLGLDMRSWDLTHLR